MAEVQPVFDKHCVACHDFGKPGAEKLILAGDRDPFFNASYTQLHRKRYITAIGAGPAGIQPPYSWGRTPARSSRSSAPGISTMARRSSSTRRAWPG